MFSAYLLYIWQKKKLGLIRDTLRVLSPDFQVVRNTMYGNVKKDTVLYHS